MKVRAAIIYLDQSGHIYLPLMGSGESCLRLNGHASELWRRWIATGVDISDLDATEQRFIDDLIARGALALDDLDAGEGRFLGGTGSELLQ